MSHPQTFQELIKAHGKAALELSGAGQSAWNGIVKDVDDGHLGLADWNGTLELDQESVIDPLREMYAAPGKQHDAAALAEYREAFSAMLHEQSHFLGPVGASQQDAKVAFRTTSAQQLEEGVTEAWTQDNLDAYLTRLGADQIAPGIENAHADESYPEFVPAARELAAGIGARTGQSEAQVLTTLNAQTAAGQWSTATDQLYNSSKLPQLVPPDQEANVKTTIEQAMRTEFERVDNLENVASHNREVLSASIGQNTVTAGLAEIHRQEQTFAPPDPSTVQTLTAHPEPTLTIPASTGPSLAAQNTTVQNTALAYPAPAPNTITGATQATGAAAGVGADGGQTVSGGAGSQVAAGDARDRTVADTSRAMVLAMGGQQPLGRSQRLNRGDVGSRREGDQAVGRSQGAERPAGERGARGE